MILDIKEIEKSYGDFKLSCSMQINEGCVTGLIGANGAGKSTLFKAILQLISIDNGNIDIFGKNQKQLSAKDKEHIGVVLAESGFSGYLTIKKIVPVLDSLYQQFNREKFLTDCKRFELPENKLLKEFSTGMRAKLNILIAMSHGARLLILDEPTSGLDVLARDELLDMMRTYMEDESHSILISSHISSDLEGLCDDIYMIQKGHIILHEDTDTLIDTFGVLKLTDEHYNSIDRTNLFYVQRTNYGYLCLTKEKQFFIDNYPQFVIEKGNVDEIMTIIEKGEKV